MVTIRLRRMGAINRPSYRVVVTDSRSARDGKYIEKVGNYNPKTKHLNLDRARIDYWLGHGAQPSATVRRLLQRPHPTPEQGGTHEGTD